MSLHRTCLLTALAALLLAACGGAPPRPAGEAPRRFEAPAMRAGTDLGHEVTLYALGLLDTGYRFGGKNPEAGFDCSGMVSYIYAQTTGLALTGSAADLAGGGRHVPRADLVPGDLVFFNTLGRAYSHVGIYIGDGRFIHAPSTASGRVRIDRLDNRYFAQRFDGGRSYLD